MKRACQYCGAFAGERHDWTKHPQPVGLTYSREEVTEQRAEARNTAFDQAANMLDRQALTANPATAALVRQLAEAVRQMKAPHPKDCSK